MGDQTLSLQKADWDETAYKHLRRIASDPCTNFYRAQVIVGQATLLRVLVDERHAGTIIARGEENFEDGGEELVIVAAAGDPIMAPIGGFISRVLPMVERMAIDLGYSHVRMHTPRLGLIKLAVDAGYAIYETVLRREVQNA